ncbi:hypothetical protein L5515_010661 [Caenorhabditis briggsae]|uniref:F-box domain-containing protein n=1 Tax=Caenorhabditis briggsae TaxID=6238 RepID=A0AAE9JFD7_CAEBR|nr:hypothetical protein L5515_010661 [Caenorhabditis briggsae]
MYSAYEKLTIFERRNINRIGIFFKLRKVELDVCGYSRTIIYENSSGNTTVTMGRIDDFQVDDNYLRVFCRDLELILKNQTDCLEYFEIYRRSNDDLEEQGEKMLEYFFEAFKKSLESRNEPLRVKSVFFGIFDVFQTLQIIFLLHAEILGRVNFKFANTINTLEILKLVYWNKGNRLKLDIDVKNFSGENLESVKTLLPYSSTFSQIEIDYGNTTEDDFETFFNFPCEQYAAKVIFFLEDVKTETIEKMEEQEEKLPEPPYLIVLKTRDLMEQIAQTLEYFDIQNLRRVSSGIRKCMDAVKPDPKIQKYRITVESNHNIKSEIFLRNGQRQFIEYSDENNSRNLDQFTINRRSLIFDDFCDVALNDFYVNLRHQKTVLEELGVKLSYKQAFYSPLSKPDDYYSDDDYSDDEFPPEEKRIPIKHERSTRMDYPNLFEFVQNFVFHLKKILESMKNLRIRKLRIGSVDAREVRRILKKCKNVESLEIFDPDKNHRGCSRMYNFPEELRNPKFDLRVILYLVYDFKELHIEIPIERDCDDEIPDVSKIGNLEIRIETISVEELSHFRTELLKSQTFEVFKIIFENMDSEDSLFANFGEPYHTIRNAKKIWYFRIPNTDFFMFVVLNPVIAGSEKPRIITFKKVRKERTPFP